MRALGVLVLSAHVAHAQPEPFDVRSPGAAAKAKALFEQGRALLADGQTDEACAKFHASWKLDQAPGTALNLGECEERAGALRAAWGLYDAAARAAERKASASRASFARDRANAIAPKLGRVELVFAEPTIGITVTVDGRAVEVGVDVADYVMPDQKFLVIVKRDTKLHRFERTVAAGKTITIDVPPMASGETLAETPKSEKTIKLVETERINKLQATVGVTLTFAGAICFGTGVYNRHLALGIGGALGFAVGLPLVLSSSEPVIIRVEASSNGAAASAHLRF